MEKEKWIQHYSSRHKILLVGEGDFSFAACLGRHLGSAHSIVATSYDSKEKLGYHYTGAGANLKQLEVLGCKIIHEVDCRTMRHHDDLKFNSFDRIVFNFPHSGAFWEKETWVIEQHKKVVRGFLENAVEMLRVNGEIHITHKTSHPFCMWEIEKLANDAGLGLFEEVPFSTSDYPGYANKYGAGHKSNQSFPVGACSTYKFKKNASSYLYV